MKEIISIFLLFSFVSFVLSSCVCNHGNCNGPTCVCLEYYEGTDCSIYNRKITSGEIIEDTISEYNWKYYNIETTNSDSTFTVHLTQTSNGDIDVYVSDNAYPSYTNQIYIEDSSNTVVSFTLPVAPNVGVYYIGLYGYSSCSFSLQVTVEQGCVGGCGKGNGVCDFSTLTCNCFAPWTGSDCSIYDLQIATGIVYRGYVDDRTWNYFHFTSTEIADLALIMTQSSSADIQLFLSREGYPTFIFFDYANTTISDQVEIHVQNLDPATWHIGLYGYIGGVFSLKADLTVPEIPHCTNDCSLHGECAAGHVCVCDPAYYGDACEFRSELVDFETTYDGLVTSSTWNFYPVQFITSQSINVHLNKLEGACNVYIRPDAYPSRISYQYFDTSNNLAVDLIIQYPASSIWFVGVYGYSDCTYDLSFSFVDRCMCGEEGNGYCPPGSTSCICNFGWAGTSCDSQATRIQSFEVIFDSVMKNEWRYYYVVSNSSALIITMEEKNTKSFAWLLISTDGFPSLDNFDDLNYGYAGELSYHENRYLWSSKRERTHYIAVFGSSLNVSPDPVQYAITVYATPF